MLQSRRNGFTRLHEASLLGVTVDLRICLLLCPFEMSASCVHVLVFRNVNARTVRGCNPSAKLKLGTSDANDDDDDDDYDDDDDDAKESFIENPTKRTNMKIETTNRQEQVIIMIISRD